MDPIELACANCGKRFRVSGRPGKRFKCSRCGNELTVPEKPPAEREGVAYCSYCWKAYTVEGRPAGTRFNCTSCGQPVTVGAGEKRRRRRSTVILPPEDKAFHEAETMIMEAASVEDPVAAAERAEQRRELEAAKAEVIETRKAYQETRSLAEQRKKKLDRLRQELSRKEEEHAAASSRLDDLRKKREGLERDSRRLRSELASAAASSAEQTGKIRELEESLRQSQQSVEKQVARMEEQSARIAELEKTLSSRVTKEETERFHAEKRELDEKVTGAARKVASFREALKGLLNPARELLRRFEEMESQAGETGLPDATAELERARDEADSLRGEVEFLRSEVQALRREIEEKGSLIAEKEEEIARRDEKIEELTRGPEEEPSAPGFFGALAQKTRGLFSRKAEAAEDRASTQSGEEKEDLDETAEVEPAARRRRRMKKKAEETPEPDELPTGKRKAVRPRKSRRKKK